MSTNSNTNSLDDARTDDERIYPAEDAYGPRRRTPAWQRIAPDLSGGYIEVSLALDCDHPGRTFEEVTQR